MLFLDKCGILMDRIAIKILLQEDLVVETIQGSPTHNEKIKSEAKQGAPTPCLAILASLVY